MLVVVDLPYSADRDISVERTVWGDRFNIQRHVFDGDSDRLVRACRDARAILSDYAAFSRPVIDALAGCQLISIAATGHNTVDIKAASERGISVCVVDEYCTAEVADHTLALMLSLLRRLPAYQRLVQEQKQWRFDAVVGMSRLRGQTLGLIGFGRIGQAVARRAQAFGMTVVSHDPNVNSEVFELASVESCDLDVLLACADIVSLHCNLDDSNQQMIDAQAFEKMSRKPILINVARGELIDETALEYALDRGQITGAGLDVLASESPDLAACGLMHRDNVVLTPHTAFYSDTSILECRRVSAQNILHHLDGSFDRVRRYVVEPRRGH